MLTDILKEMSTPIALALAALLLMAAVHKLSDRSRMLEAVTSLSGLSAGLAPVALTVMAALEAAAAILLLWPQTAMLGAGIAVAIWGGYLGMIVNAIARGRRHLDCGCSFGKRHGAIGGFDVLRNLVLISFAGLVMAASPASHAFADPTAILAALGFVLLYIAAEQLAVLAVYTSVHHRN
ncbi:MauE/DoxX family redox-associated membrane protein [Govanella unica]|uniref:Methylamine utilization protein MauE n=1 Tax=Govanella unica TaxID=2975056 RepID=A0A9X3U264_9PROT|nr:MauE/DoxX family redox-associated membrane protein [Govania unica]MDA5195054.1 hypothetical protein [Govania unica]